MFHHRSAIPAGVAGKGEVRSLGDNVTSIYGSVVEARADTTTASTKNGGERGKTDGFFRRDRPVWCHTERKGVLVEFGPRLVLPVRLSVSGSSQRGRVVGGSGEWREEGDL